MMLNHSRLSPNHKRETRFSNNSNSIVIQFVTNPLYLCPRISNTNQGKMNKNWLNYSKAKIQDILIDCLSDALNPIQYLNQIILKPRLTYIQGPWTLFLGTHKRKHYKKNTLCHNVFKKNSRVSFSSTSLHLSSFPLY